jgi:hypothetical protein
MISARSSLIITGDEEGPARFRHGRDHGPDGRARHHSLISVWRADIGQPAGRHDENRTALGSVNMDHGEWHAGPCYLSP